MAVEKNKELVRRFFNEALDRNDVGLLDDMFDENCVFYRGDLDEPVQGLGGVRAIVEKRALLYRDFESEIHSVIGEGDLVASGQTHTGVHRGEFPTPIGTFNVKDRPIEWSSQVFFRFEGDKISEVRVARDELALLRYLDIKLEAQH